MAYRVILQKRAERDLRSIAKYIQTEVSAAAAEWIVGLLDHILSLKTMPKRGAVAQQSPEVRQVAYGSKPHIYLILYTVDSELQTVNVIHIRHGARRPTHLRPARSVEAIPSRRRPIR
jgi:plasmid stabilization system protein ParE